ncbi:hypothetical protein D3C80_2148430 [compost metagenome]
MRNDDAGHRGVLAKRVDTRRQRLPDLMRHVLAAHVGNLFSANVGDAGQLGYGTQ